MINNIKLVDYSMCSGCGACAHTCPKKAIVMADNKYGFQYPFVNEKLCINCGLCLKACQCLSTASGKIIKPYLGYSIDTNKTFLSTSGGVFFLIASEFLNKGGAVYGAAFELFPNLKHIRVTDIEQLKRLQGSKYVWSDISHVYDLVIEDLDNNIEVLFSGTPCQINGLKLFLKIKGVKCDKLYTLSTACLGNSSKKFFNEYINSFDTKTKIIDYSFRKRMDNVQVESFTDSQNKETIVSSPYGNSLYMNPFFSNLSFRESCYNCKAKECNMADLLIGDYWGARDAYGCNISKTPNLCVPLTEKGAYLLSIIDNSKTILSEKNSLCDNPYLFSSVKKPSSHDDFIKAVEEKGFVVAAKQFHTGRKKTSRSDTKQSIRNDEYKRICILTQNDMSNYGNRFQNIALSLFVSNNYKVRVSTCWPCFGATAKNRIFYPARKVQYFFRDLLKQPSFKWLKRKNGFRKFNKLIKLNHSLLSPLKPFSFLNRSADYFILGSDQVWNKDYGFKAPLNNLSFCQPWKRITYAVSCGRNIDSFVEDFDKKNLPFFMNISTRECQLSNYISNNCISSFVSNNIDPTFLISRDEWINIFDSKVSKKAVEIAKKDYVFVYWLGDETKSDKEYIDSFAKSHSLDVIYLRTNSSDTYKTFVDASPFDFLYLLNNSKFAISKSFHGLAMSIIFHKNFFAVTNQKNNLPLDDRITNLFSLFDISYDHIFSAEKHSLPNTPNWESISDIIETEKAKSLELFDNYFKRRK